MAVTLPITSYAYDVHALVERGDVNQMSFAFRPRKGGETWVTEEGQRLRRLRSLSLYDVSVVTYPAYQATTVAARTLEMARQTELDSQEAAEITAEPTDDRAVERTALRRRRLNLHRSTIQ
jgi:phage head maturation protease